jgi:outer membrane receptor for ferrienterochelin and colicin
MQKVKIKMHLTRIQFLFLLVFSLFASGLMAQKDCVISGKILDKATGETMIGAVVQVEGTDIGVTTDIEGNYSLSLAPGSYTLNILYVGMTPGKISVEAKEGEVVNVDFAMDTKESALEEVVVVATADRSSDVVMNIELKKAAYIASGITSSEIRKTPDRTVGDILKRVTGASIQDGKFVIIRGMNDRYNAGYLDGSLLSSTEADRKAFAFDVIPAALIDNLVIIKSGSPDLIGDFGGGVIKINTKSVPDKLTQNISVGAQFHSLTSSRPFTEFKTYPGENANFISSERDIPEFEEGSLRLSSNNPTSEEKERLAGISKTFNNDWSSSTTNATPNMRVAYSIGFPMKVGESGRMGLIMALNYANTRRISDNEVNTFDGSGQVAGFTDRAFLRNLNTGGLLNLNYVNRNTQLSLRNLVNVTSDFNVIARTGVGNYQDALTVQNTANILNSNKLYNGILSFKQLIRDTLMAVEASLSYSKVLREIPDYRIASYTKTPDFDDFRLQLGDFFNSSTGRFASIVDENLLSGAVEFSKKFKGDKTHTEVKLGYFQQHRDRDFSGRSFVYHGSTPEKPTLDPAHDLGQDNIDATKLYLVEKTSDDLSYYTGTSETRAVYAMANQSIGKDLKAVYGLRVEDFDLDVHNNKTNQAISSIKETVWLPSVILTYSLNEKTNLRASYFSSVNRPEFRELAPFSFFVFDKNAEIRGEKDLKIANLNNIDVRYEFYPSGGQLISIGGFYKHIKNPIELSLDITQPFTTFTYQNEQAADILGLEVELKKKLDFIGGGVFQRMALYGNMSLIKSTLQFEPGSQAKNDRPLQGQSPYIINGRLQYENQDNGWTASISYNLVGRRIAYVGVDPKYGDTRQDIYEDPRSVLDLQVGKTFGKLNIKLTLGDLLHQDLIYYQDANQDGKYNESAGPGGTADRLMYIFNAGFTTNLGLSYTF